MSTQPRSDQQPTASTSWNPFGAKDLTALAATLSPVGSSAREALIATAPYCQSEFREDFAEYVCAARVATDVIDAATAAGDLNAPASAAAGLRSRTAPRGKPRTSERCHDDLASVEGLTVALRRARDRSETASRARRPLLSGARRDLREPLTATLRLTDLASRSAGGKLGKASAAPEPRAEEWSAECSMISAVDCPEVPVAVGPASRVRRVLLIDEDRGVLDALRIYLLCAGYRVFAADNAEEALDRARMATSLIDIIVANLDLTGADDGVAVIDKTRLLLGYNVPAVLLTNQTSTEIGKPALVVDVFLLRSPVNLDELGALIGEVLKCPRRSRLAYLRTTGAKLGHDEPNPEVVC